jgi:hypothetical protein
MKDEYLIKYLDSKLSFEASQDVEKWVVLSEDNTEHFNTLKAQYIIKSLRKTEATIDVDEKYQTFKHNHIDKGIQIKSLYKYAAAIAILITTTVLFYNTEQKETMVPNDAITLELEDGTLKVLEADGTSIMTNNNGNVLLEQKGNQLIYSSDSEVEKLVYNTLTIPHGKTFKLKLSDGTIVHMNAGSSTRYPIKFIKGSNRKIFITGEAYLDVTKDPSHPFIVNSNYLNIRVLGTKFNINSYPEDDVTEIVLVEGSVSLYDESKIYDIKSSALLKPKHKAIFTRKNKDIQIHPVNTNIYTSWRNGELVFRDMTFNNILKKMERHYNITIINNNSNLSKTIFNASFGIVPIEKVLQELREVYGISYTINNRTITIK